MCAFFYAIPCIELFLNIRTIKHESLESTRYTIIFMTSSCSSGLLTGLIHTTVLSAAVGEQLYKINADREPESDVGRQKYSSFEVVFL